MKDTFQGPWSTIKDIGIDKVSDLIVTGKAAAEADAATWLPEFLKDTDKPITLLDFGCGFGRNSFWLAQQLPHWTIIGYDSEQMISRVPEFASIKYGGTIPNNLWFVSDWEQLKHHYFDKIMCIIVLQHIFEIDLANYIKDFKTMTSMLFVHGRRYNDDWNQRSTWTILEENGLHPNEFYLGHERIEYSALGEPGEHNSAYYLF